jgi:outer membrane protein TolC
MGIGTLVGCAGAHLTRKARSVTMVALIGGLSGCASFSPDQGMGAVQHMATASLRKDVVKVRNEDDAAEVRGRVKTLLSGPLTANAAVQIALLNNRGLQAAFYELGVSEAQMVEASLPPSPTLSVSRMVVSGAVLEIERQILQNVLGLLTLPRRREIAEDRFEQAKLRAVEAVLRTAADTRRTYYEAVAAGQTVIFLMRAKVAAESLSDLATKLGQTGAMGKLSQARQHAFYADVIRQIAIARLKHRSARDRLARLMGLWGGDLNYKLPDALPSLPRAPRMLHAVEKDAVAKRIDLQIAREELEILAKSYGLTRATRFINVLEVRGISVTEWRRITEVDYELTPGPTLVKTETPDTEKERWRGIELEFQIPIYDFGKARTRRASEAYLMAANKLADLAINVRGQAREAYEVYRGSYDIAKIYRQKLLPLRNVISEEMLLQYNGMLADLFELIQDSRARIQSNVEAIGAERDFWVASAGLDAAILGGGGAPSGVGGGGAGSQAPEGGGGGH